MHLSDPQQDRCKDGRISAAEASAMRFVRKNTTIPVSEVRDAYINEKGDRGYIIMDYVEGTQLDEAWPSFCSSEKEGVCAQLKGYIDQLRSFRGTTIGSVAGTHCEDPFSGDEFTGYGPLETFLGFHQGSIRSLKAKEQSPWTGMVVRSAESLPHPENVLTHSDVWLHAIYWSTLQKSSWYLIGKSVANIQLLASMRRRVSRTSGYPFKLPKMLLTK